MNPRLRIARYIVLVVGGLLCLIGVLHDIVNIPAIRRAITRGEITERMGPQLVANVALAGLALALLGVLLLLNAPELGKGKRAAWRMSTVIGLFLVFSGVAAYIWLPREGVLCFSALGGAVCGPLLMWRKEFSVE